jgi:hypothetical protein
MGEDALKQWRTYLFPAAVILLLALSWFFIYWQQQVSIAARVEPLMFT